MIRLLQIVFGLFLATALHAQTVLVKPYVQPGDGSTLGESDVKVIAWLTDQTPGEFVVEYGVTPALGKTAQPKRVALDLSPRQKYFNYSATLPRLPFNSTVHYRVRLGGKAVREGKFATRKTADQSTRFIVVGDTADGKPDQRKVAYAMAQTAPEFMLIVGDIVYSKGRVSEYMTNFWPVYNNVEKAGPATGAPMMASIPFYGVIGNHDVGATNLAAYADGFAAFYFFHPPLNGPKNNPWNTPIAGPAEQVAAFKAAAPSYPGLCNYSFDNGAGHFLCLDANRYVAVTDASLQKWIRDDLTKTKARWKMVFFHHPGFNSSAKHNSEQKMRLLAPLFEECGVDMVFAGHVHNYQRSKPLKFQPANATRLNPKGNVAGQFTLDEKFDGAANTRPDGILYIVTGGGGAKLYDPEFTNQPDKWKNDEGHTVPFTTKLIADRHSFSVVELDQQTLVLRQVDEDGKEIDRITVTK
ncbi:MAG: metallophosphoesterase family protein [Verrucomicrobia bacterium]|nr:metallophosphoesterase family protein [Verrucomicrobiota bacterium]